MTATGERRERFRRREGPALSTAAELILVEGAPASSAGAAEEASGGASSGIAAPGTESTFSALEMRLATFLPVSASVNGTNTTLSPGWEIGERQQASADDASILKTLAEPWKYAAVYRKRPQGPHVVAMAGDS